MNTLVQMKCVACRGGEPTATEAEMAEYQPLIPDWKIVERDGIRRLERVFKFKDFAQALGFTKWASWLS
jgi:4a-hydroxytetrahydrobiopterin dehydratase